MITNAAIKTVRRVECDKTRQRELTRLLLMIIIDYYRRKKGSKTQELRSNFLLFVEGFQKRVTATSSVE